jgi:hypothetical protein
MSILPKGIGFLALAALALACGVAGTTLAADENAAPKPDPLALARRIDQAILQRLNAEKVRPSPLADDAEFLRRVYLDLTGAIPPADKAAAFLDSKDRNKRAQLIDELLADPRYGRYMADIWQALLLPRTSDNRRLQPQPLISWLEENFNSNKPWDQFVAELLTATGPQDKNGAVTFFLANPTADKVTDTVSKLFLGVQLQCAQCHNHPFTSWKQDEYWAMATFFTKVRADNVNRAARLGNMPGINEGGRGRAPRLPESAKVVPAKFLQGEEPKLNRSEPYRPVLAKWMTSPDNPFFARATVNRLWAHFFGRGFVTPVDDMHEGNAPSHPELLQELAGQFTASDFDLKHLIRAICNSRTYQRTSKPAAGNDKDVTLFSHMAIKVLSPGQLYDSLVQVIGAPRQNAPRNRQAQQRGPGANPRAQFVAFFQAEEGADPTEYQAGIPQALRLMNSPQLTNGAALLNQIARAGGTPAQNLERLYLATLSRRPTAVETRRLFAYLKEHVGEVRQAYSDVLWALLNSSEFTLNH